MHDSIAYWGLLVDHAVTILAVVATVFALWVLLRKETWEAPAGDTVPRPFSTQPRTTRGRGGKQGISYNMAMGIAGRISRMGGGGTRR